MRRRLVDKIRKHPVIACWLIFMICAAARIMEYFFIKTDESFLAENSIHKLFGIFLLFVILSISKMKWKDIGFVNEHAAWNCGKGILLGSVCFTVAYGMECLILYIANQNVKLEFYASGFSLNGGTEKQTGILFVLICIAFNIINVWMEEGVFRGLFQRNAVSGGQGLLVVLLQSQGLGRKRGGLCRHPGLPRLGGLYGRDGLDRLCTGALPCP